MLRPNISRLSRETVATIACLAVGLAYWIARTTAFIAEDSYFYVATARRLALEGTQSFNGLYSTNGVHPLHFYILALWSWLIGHIRPEWLWVPAFAVPVSFVLVTVGALNFLAVERELDLGRGMLVLPPLILVLGFGVLYSEAHVLYCSLSLWARLAVRGEWLGTWRRALAAGLVHAVVFLARLDSVFFVVASGVAIVWSERPRRGAVLVAAGAFLAIVGPYLASNLLVFGGLLPISGWLKSTFPQMQLRGLEGSPFSFSATLCKYNIAFGVLPIMVSAIIALAIRGKLCRRLLRTGSVLLAGAASHMFYTMLFATWCGWYWYYVLPFVTGSFWVAAFVRVLPRRTFISTTAAVAVPAFLVALLVLGRTSARRAKNAAGMDSFVAKNKIENSTLLLSEWPGTIAFRTTNSIIAADLLTANRRVYEELVASGNAFARIFEMAQSMGRPVQYIVWHGGDFIQYDRERGELVWLDPRVVRRERVIGRMHVGRPVAEDVTSSFAIWRAK